MECDWTMPNGARCGGNYNPEHLYGTHAGPVCWTHLQEAARIGIPITDTRVVTTRMVERRPIAKSGEGSK